MNGENLIKGPTLDLVLAASAGCIQHASTLDTRSKTGRPRILYIVHKKDFESTEKFLPLLKECTGVIINQMTGSGNISPETVKGLSFNWIYDSCIERDSIISAITKWTLVYVMKWDETDNIVRKESDIQHWLQNQYTKDIAHSSIYLDIDDLSSKHIWTERNSSELLFYQNYWSISQRRKPGFSPETCLSRFVTRLIHLFEPPTLLQPPVSLYDSLLRQSPMIINALKDVLYDTISATGPLLLMGALFHTSNRPDTYTPEYQQQGYVEQDFRVAKRWYPCPPNPENLTMCQTLTRLPWNDVIFNNNNKEAVPSFV